MYPVLYHILHSTVQWYSVVHYMLHCIVLYYTMLYSNALESTALYHSVLIWIPEINVQCYLFYGQKGNVTDTG